MVCTSTYIRKYKVNKVQLIRKCENMIQKANNQDKRLTTQFSLKQKKNKINQEEKKFNEIFATTTQFVFIFTGSYVPIYLHHSTILLFKSLDSN